MSLLSNTATKRFNVLSIGQRGVGKTVFLAGSYTELYFPTQTDNAERLWFDCQDSEAKENIEDILNYISKTSLYPPSTMKITNFNFSLKRHTSRGSQTLCNFRWWDIPGESCNIKNLDFRKMVLNSHGCCVFIDAYGLVHKPTYYQEIEESIQAAIVISNLVYMNSLKFPFALILTKCDLLEPSLLNHKQFSELLQPLTICLDKVKARYQIFYSNIPIVHTEGTSILKPRGAADPLLWLVLELSKMYKPTLSNNLNLSQLMNLSSPIPIRSQLQEQVEGTLEHLLKPSDKKINFIKLLGLYLSLNDIQYTLKLALILCVSIGGVSLLFDNYAHILQNDSNLDTTSEAVSSVEKLVEKEPSRIQLRLQLAQLYETTGQAALAETAYEQILRQEKDNIEALIGKALLRHAQGDTKTAKALFVQAEKAASTKSQAENIRAVAQKTLHPSIK
jgi:tetratricopeptide (TPR) repeat protein